MKQITITIAGDVGIGKSAVALTVIDALRAAGLECTWKDEREERNAGCENADTLEHKPTIEIREQHKYEPAIHPESKLARAFASLSRLVGDGDDFLLCNKGETVEIELTRRALEALRRPSRLTMLQASQIRHFASAWANAAALAAACSPARWREKKKRAIKRDDARDKLHAYIRSETEA